MYISWKRGILFPTKIPFNLIFISIMESSQYIFIRMCFLLFFQIIYIMIQRYLHFIYIWAIYWCYTLMLYMKVYVVFWEIKSWCSYFDLLIGRVVTFYRTLYRKSSYFVSFHGTEISLDFLAIKISHSRIFMALYGVVHK